VAPPPTNQVIPVRFGKAAVGTVAVLITAAPHALSVTGVPLRTSNGVVVAWNASARSNVVTTSDGRVLVIHSLRRFRTGTRVHIRGIKWGRVVGGIKWGVNPRGIKWGIMQARNGTYFARLRTAGRTRTFRLRGTVVRRYSGGVGISVPGATFTLRSNRGAWSGGSTLMAGQVGGVGSRVQLAVRVTSAGTAIVTRARELTPAKPGASLPYAGTVTAVDRATGIITVDATTDPKLPLTFTLTTAAGANLASVKRGALISGIARTSPTGGPELYATVISDNSSFAGADNPATTVQMAAPDAQMLVSIHGLRGTWRQSGIVEGKFTQQGHGLAESGSRHLAQVELAIKRNDLPFALDKLTRVVLAVQTANLPEGSPIKIDPTFQVQLLSTMGSLQRLLTERVLASGGTVIVDPLPPNGPGGPGAGGAGAGQTDGDAGTINPGNGNGNNGNGNHGSASSGNNPNGNGNGSANAGNGAGTANNGNNGNNGAPGSVAPGPGTGGAGQPAPRPTAEG